MSQPEARAWWADVQHVRETIERRRAADHRDGSRRRRAEQYAPRFEDIDWADDLTEPRRRFARDEVPAAPALPVGEIPAAAAAPARRTIQITGRTVAAPALRQVARDGRRRPARRPIERLGRRPDRIALWAVGLAFFLILVAATSSSQAATPAPERAPALVAPAPSR